MLRRKRYWLLVIVPVGVLAGLGLWYLTLEPPGPAFDEARAALARARRAGADRYAPEAFRVAEAQWDTALHAWKQENGRWFVLRDYDAIGAHAEGAAHAAEGAFERALHVRDSLETFTRSEMARVAAQIAATRAQMGMLPFDERLHAAHVASERLLVAARTALAEDDLWTSAEQVAAAAAGIERAGARLTERVDTYLAHLDAWRAWADETVAWSRRTGRAAIVVDKMGRQCRLYVGGRLKGTFPVELGPNWIGPKRYQGDDATPEGRYRVSVKRGPGRTIYHRALEIDYPNAEDRRRFETARRRGDLPARARIGGLIELHGHGGRGADWTRGCVALRNDDIDVLFRHAGVGTPVTIVGALDTAAVAARRRQAPAPAPPTGVP